jgi:hypothetical protein
MTDASEIIWAGPSEDDNGVLWDVGHWGADFDENCIKYIRYDKHTAYMADMRAAYYGSCDQIDEYRERRETDKARIAELEAARDFGIIEGDVVAHLTVVALQTRVEELEAALTAMLNSFDRQLIGMDEACDVANTALKDNT